MRNDVLLAVPVGHEVSDLSIDMATEKLNPENRLLLVDLFNELVAHLTLRLGGFLTCVLHELMILAHWNDVY